MLRTLLPVAALLASACAVPPAPDFTWFPAAGSLHARDEAAPASASHAILSGFDAPDSARTLRAGDEVLFSIVADLPDGSADDGATGGDL